MKMILCGNYNEMSATAADMVADEIKTNPKCILGLATGSTPVGMYEKLARMNANGILDFSQIRTFNLDEYYPIAADNPQSYHGFMNENFFSHINIKPENTHILDGMCADPEAECERFENEIQLSGGIDLQILGIGRNGHIGFNEPSENLNLLTHMTELTESTVEANSRFFENADEVPRRALTMGIGSIMRAKKIILMASGEDKRDAVRSLLTNAITTEMPASMLKLHKDVTIICDRKAYGD